MKRATEFPQDRQFSAIAGGGGLNHNTPTAERHAKLTDAIGDRLSGHRLIQLPYHGGSELTENPVPYGRVLNGGHFPPQHDGQFPVASIKRIESGIGQPIAVMRPATALSDSLLADKPGGLEPGQLLPHRGIGNANVCRKIRNRCSDHPP